MRIQTAMSMPSYRDWIRSMAGHELARADLGWLARGVPPRQDQLRAIVTQMRRHGSSDGMRRHMRAAAERRGIQAGSRDFAAVNAWTANRIARLEALVDDPSMIDRPYAPMPSPIVDRQRWENRNPEWVTDRNRLEAEDARLQRIRVETARLQRETMAREEARRRAERERHLARESSRRAAEAAAAAEAVATAAAAARARRRSPTPDVINTSLGRWAAREAHRVSVYGDAGPSSPLHTTDEARKAKRREYNSARRGGKRKRVDDMSKEEIRKLTSVPPDRVPRGSKELHKLAVRRRINELHNVPAWSRVGAMTLDELRRLTALPVDSTPLSDRELHMWALERRLNEFDNIPDWM